MIWLLDCNFHFFTISKLVFRSESCYCISILYMKVVYSTKSKIGSHTHYTSPLSMFVQLYNFNFKMVLAFTSCPEKGYISNSFHTMEASNTSSQMYMIFIRRQSIFMNMEKSVVFCCFELCAELVALDSLNNTDAWML